MKSSLRDAATPSFWRDEALPFVEARSVVDGRRVCYAKHSHETFSIGAITHGRSTYLNGRAREQVSTGAVVIMNPEDVHACNPIKGEPWSYRMLYVDRVWLANLQHELGSPGHLDFQTFSTTVTMDPVLFAGLNSLYAMLTSETAKHMQQHTAVVSFFGNVQQSLNHSITLPGDDNFKLRRAADFISDNCTRTLKLEEICMAADLSASYLIRSFKKHYGMTPHAYLVNRRIQYGLAQLKRGRSIVEVALEAGFADQAHFQRAFKHSLAATPGQYRA